MHLVYVKKNLTRYYVFGKNIALNWLLLACILDFSFSISIFKYSISIFKYIKLISFISF